MTPKLIWHCNKLLKRKGFIYLPQMLFFLIFDVSQQCPSPSKLLYKLQLNLRSKTTTTLFSKRLTDKQTIIIMLSQPSICNFFLKHLMFLNWQKYCFHEFGSKQDQCCAANNLCPSPFYFLTGRGRQQEKNPYGSQVTTSASIITQTHTKATSTYSFSRNIGNI